MSAAGSNTESSNVAEGSVHGKNLGFEDSEENFLNKHHGLLNPFKHVPTIQFDQTGSIIVVDVPLVSEPTSILNPRRDEVLAPPSTNSLEVHIDQPDETPGGQVQVIGVTSSIQDRGLRRSQRRQNQSIYNEQLLTDRILRLVRCPNMTRASNYQLNMMRASNYRPYTMRASDYRPHMTRASNYQPHMTRASNYRPYTTRASNYQPNMMRASNYRPYTMRASNYQPNMMRASNYRRVLRDDDSE